MDLGIELITTLFQSQNLSKLFDLAQPQIKSASDNAQRIWQLRAEYILSIDGVILFLQGRNQTLSQLIASDDYLPRASRFDQIDDLDWAFGTVGSKDKAKHLATLYLEDLSDFIIECIDPQFGFSRYAEQLGKSASHFDQLYSKLQEKPSIIDQMAWGILEAKIVKTHPKLIGFSVPFPGNLYSAFRLAKWIKSLYPMTKIVMGGGFANTELRSLSDVRVFEFFDFITLDDGELPLELLWKNIQSKSSVEHELSLEYKRTFYLKNKRVFFDDSSKQNDYSQKDLPSPDYTDLALEKYISVIEVANPMHSLWSDGRWNKLTMAHGCYWAKCTFCDISLDYIRRYDPNTASTLVDKMEQIIAQTGESGFHFVDEAAPPTLMKAMAQEILKRNLKVSWWTNVRFEKSFTYDMCRLLRASGCIAVSGGLEVASDRLLDLINKGVTVEQVAQVTQNLTDSGIMVHAYLMYAYPTQTVQETIDSLEMVRQLFEQGVIQSAFWHHFALTCHSEVYKNYTKFGIEPHQNAYTFAHNDIEFTDKTKIDHNRFAYGLSKSLINYMHGIGFEMPLGEWFDFKTPETKIPEDYIQNCIQTDDSSLPNDSSNLIWLGHKPIVETYAKLKKGQEQKRVKLQIHTKTDLFEVKMDYHQGIWMAEMLDHSRIDASQKLTFGAFKSGFESKFGNFELFWHASAMEQLRSFGLLFL